MMKAREFYTAIIEKNFDAELTEFAIHAIENLDKTNERRRKVSAEKAVEKEVQRAPIREAIVGAMTTEPKTASTLIAEAEVDIKPQAIPSLLKALVENGTVVKGKVKVAGKGMQVGYSLAE